MFLRKKEKGEGLNPLPLKLSYEDRRLKVMTIHSNGNTGL
jgi:hypothetical protein